MRMLPDAAYWRDRAEEAFTMADEMKDPVARQLMRDVGEEYDRMATEAEEPPAKQ